MKLTEKEREKIDDLFDYLYIDWGHHKQYALVEIAKILCGKSKFELRYPDVDKGIPA